MHPKHILQRHNLEPKKSLGQNFLFDEQILGKLITAGDVGQLDEVLEIGPGIGRSRGSWLRQLSVWWRLN